MKSKRSILFLIVLAAALVLSFFSPALVFAQNNSVQMSAASAFSGYFKYGEWLPVWVELSNRGADLEAEVRVQISSSQGLLVFSVPVSLPSGSRKRVPVYVLPNNFSREMEVRLVSDGKTVTSTKTTLRPQPNISFMVGILAPERGAMALLNGVKIPGQERAKVLVDLTLDDIPDRSEALRSFDLLIINDTDTSTLTPGQAEALAGWVQQGGHMVVGGGAGSQHATSGLPESLLPITVQTIREVGLEDLQALAVYSGRDPILSSGPFAAAAGKIDESSIVIGTKSSPLLLERPFGSGLVHFSTLDLASAPFNGWPGTQGFWEKVIGPAGSYPENVPFDMSMRQYRANSLFYALSNIPSLDLPSVRGLSILLILYVLIVGPFNYLVLRWKKILHFAWVTIPIITVLFSAAAFGIGYGMRGNDLVLNKIALVETRPDGNALVTSYMGLFSPRQQSYEVTVAGESLVSPMTGYDPGGWGPGAITTGGEMVFQQGSPSKVKGLTVNQWAMQSFMSEGQWEDIGSLTGELRIENETLVGTIRNESTLPLTDVVVIMQNRFARLGDMNPGEEREVSLGLSSTQSDRFGPPLSYRLYQERFTSGPPPRAIELKSNIVSSVFENGPYMKAMLSSRMPTTNSITSGSILVFGWADQAPPDIQVERSRLSQQTTTLVYTTLNYAVPTSGVLSLPLGMVPGMITKYPNNGGTCGPMGTTSVSMGRGEAEFEYQVPADLGKIQVDTLKLALWRDSGGPWDMPKISLYNWSDETWTTIQEPIQGTNVIQKAAPYVSESGVVRVRISTESETFGCIYIDMGMEAQVITGQEG